MKPVLGHLEFIGKSKATKSEKEEPRTGDVREPPSKCRVTQLISSLKEAKRKENISLQEQ